MEEPRAVTRDAPRAIIAGITAVLAIYTLITIGIFRFIPANQIHQLGENTTTYLANTVFGAIGGKILSIGIIICYDGNFKRQNADLP